MFRTILLLTRKYLWNNKRRNLFLGISIFLSIMLITVIDIVGSILSNNAFKKIVDNTGIDYDVKATYYGTSIKSMEQWENKDFIKSKAVKVTLGQVENIQKRYSMVIDGYGDDTLSVFNITMKEGAFPEKGNEIALEEKMVEKFNPIPKLGDEIKLTFMRGKQAFTENFTFIGTFKYRSEMNKNEYMGRAAVTRECVEKIVGEKYCDYEGYFKFNYGTSISDGYRTVKLNSSENITIEKNEYKVRITKMTETLTKICKFLYVIIGIVTSILIYNMFNASTLMRIKELGGLRAIGASSIDIKILIIIEAIVIGIIFIALGIGGAILGHRLIINGEGFTIEQLNRMYITAATRAAIVGLSVVIFGAYWSARRGGKLSPMEAITGVEGVELFGEDKRIILNKMSFDNDNFKFSRVMAVYNIKRNKKKFITTVISIAVTIILFMQCVFLNTTSDPIKAFKDNFNNADFSMSSLNGAEASEINEEIVKKIEAIDGVSKVKVGKSLNGNITLSKDRVLKGADEYSEVQFGGTEGGKALLQQLKSNGRYQFGIEVISYDEDRILGLKKKLLSGDINLEEMRNKPLCILEQNTGWDAMNLKVGDKITLEIGRMSATGGYETKSCEVVIRGIIENSTIVPKSGSTAAIIIMTNDMMKGKLEVKGYQRVNIYANFSSNKEVIEKKLKDICESKSESIKVKSYKEGVKETIMEKYSKSALLYGIIIIIGLVSIGNIFNIMVMNVVLRKKEFGMLRGVGMTKGEIRSMLMWEGAYYGFMSSTIGLMIGIIFSRIFYAVTKGKLSVGMKWTFPIGTSIGVFIVVIGVCLLSALSASRMLYGESLVESVKSVE